MAFKKIDADAVNADEPLDAFVLQGVDANLDAARENRLRRASMCWPTDLRPKLAAHKTVAYPIARWPVIPGVTEVTLEVLHDVNDASVFMGLAKLTARGLDIDDDDLTEETTGSDQRLTLTCDVSAFQGRTVDLFLLVRSAEATSPAAQEVTVDGATDGNVTENLAKLRLPNGHGITQLNNTGDRWVVSFNESASSSNLDRGDEFPGPRTVIDIVDPTGDTELWVWPLFERENLLEEVPWATGNYDVRVATLGHSEVWSMRVFDSAVTSFADEQGRQLPGFPPVAHAIQSLYLRGLRLHSRHTRVHHVGQSVDRQRTDGNSNVVSLWNEFIDYDDSGYQTLGSALLGNYARNNIEGGSSRYRSKVVVAGWLYGIAGTWQGLEVSVKIRASLWSFAGTSWSGSETNGTALTLDVPLVTRLSSESAALFVFGAPNYHYLRGAVSARDLDNGLSGLIPFEVEVEDDQTTAGDRQLRLEVLGVTADNTDLPLLSQTSPRIFCCGFTVWERDGVYGT